MDAPVPDPGEQLVLEIAAEPRYVSLARLFAASAARDAGCDEEIIDDVKIAVSEAVTSALRADDGDGIVRVTVSRPDAGLEIAIARMSSSSAEEPAAEERTDLGMAVISALFPDAEGESGSAVRFIVPLGSRAPADQHP